MTATSDSQSAATLTRDECVANLRRHSLGRIAVSHRGLPQILPINYTLDGAAVMFRTDEGGLLDRCCHDTVVAFEVADYDDHAGAGWSVHIVGTASVLDAGDSLRAIEMQLESAGASDGKVFVKVVPGVISGRRIGPEPVRTV